MYENTARKYKTFTCGRKKNGQVKRITVTANGKVGKSGDLTDTFGEWAERWMNENELIKGVSDSQLNNHRINIRYLNSVFEREKISDIKCSDFQRFINKTQMCGFKGKPLSRSTLKNIFSTAQLIWKYALANDVPASYFFDAIILPAAAKSKKRRALTEEEQQMIIDTPHRAQLPAMIMLFAGLRRGECLALTWDDIDLVNGLIKVERSLDLATGQIKAGGKTKNAVRIVPIPPILVDYLSGVERTGSYVCTNINGDLFKSKSFECMWNSYLLDMNVKYGYPIENVSKFDPNGLPMKIEKFTPHYLRHTFATFLYLEGIDPVTAKSYLGHSKIQTTIDVYTDFNTLNKLTISDELRRRLENEYKIRGS